MENTPSTTAIPTISIHIRDFNGVPTECVDARELHTAMNVGRVFANWIKDRIHKYRFEIEVDYVLISRLPERASGNRGAATDYYVTLDMAKELAMLERSELGQQARRYFIHAEKAGRADRVELEQLRQQLEELKADPGLEPLTKAEAAQLRSMVAGIALREKHDLQSLAFRRTYSRLRDRFAVKSYSLIPRFRFMEAVAYLQDINELFEPEPGLRTLPDPMPEYEPEPAPVETPPTPEPKPAPVELNYPPAELEQQIRANLHQATLSACALKHLCDNSPAEEVVALLWMAELQQRTASELMESVCG